MSEFKLPELGENIESADVIRLLVSEGDVIKPDQAVMELESEKATVTLPSAQAGKVTQIHVKEGDSVSVGQTLLTLEDEGKPEAEAEQGAETREREPKERQKPSAAEPEAEQPSPKLNREAAVAPEEVEKEAKLEAAETAERRAAVRAPAAGGNGRRARTKAPAPPAGPATRRLARAGGRFAQDPGQRAGWPHYARGRAAIRAAAAHCQRGSREAGVARLFGRWGGVERRRLSKMARTAAERLSRTWRLVPHVTQHELADITELEAFRAQHASQRTDSAPKITVTVLALKAAVAALKVYPQFNSSLDLSTGELIVKQYYHIGVAVDTEQGLVVPVVRDADRKSIVQLAAEVAKLAQKARDRSLTPDQMQGGTFTITNLGGIGGASFTPIINFPEVAILGMAQARWQQVLRQGRPENRFMLPLSLSYDHRAVHGADGARFIGKLAQLLSDPWTMLTEC